jgi:hypothetical protein
MGPAMMYSSNQSSLRNIAMNYCLSLIIYVDLFELTCINLPEPRINRLFFESANGIKEICWDGGYLLTI